jgi:hypothetical protein
LGLLVKAQGFNFLPDLIFLDFSSGRGSKMMSSFEKTGVDAT